MAKDDLLLRIYFQPCMYDLARFISYDGRRDAQVREKCDDLPSRFGDAQVMNALLDLTAKDEKSGLTVLRPHVCLPREKCSAVPTEKCSAPDSRPGRLKAARGLDPERQECCTTWTSGPKSAAASPRAS